MNFLAFFVFLTIFLIQCNIAKGTSDLQTQENYNQYDQEWEEYKAKHKKQYSKEEDLKRKQKYIRTKSLIDDHNAAYKEGKVTYEMETNQWTDQDPEEFKHLRGFKHQEGVIKSSRRLYKINLNNDSLPDCKDWREDSAVTSVKDQGSCGSCWAFSAVAAVESQFLIKYGRLVDLSEQELIDCSTNNEGCEGGMYTTAFEYMDKNNGLSSELTYPYRSMKGVCLGGSSIKFRTRYDNMQGEDDMKYYVAKHGPISVAIDATDNLQRYKRGIFDDPLCSESPNHAVLIVGYGTLNGVDYWLVKNSWGTNWGEKGYFKIRRNTNSCAIATLPVFPEMTSAAIKGASLGLPIIISFLNIILNQIS